MSLDAILSRIASGESVPQSELLPYLCIERRERRAEVNRLLAEACLGSGRAERLADAAVFVRRAWLLGGFQTELLPLYTRIHAAVGDVEGIRDAYKRAGVEAAARGDVPGALRYFDLWQYAYHDFSKLDRYEYDFDILDCVERLARPHRLAPPARAGGGPLRVAYLVKGMTETGSILVKINLLFARFHDRSRVEPLFFAPEPESQVLASEAGREHMRLFESHGCGLTAGPDAPPEVRLPAVARMIRDAGADVLVTGAALAHFEHFYVAALRPAPAVFGFIQGPPPQFAPLSLDWGFAWGRHPLIEAPVSCSFIELGLDLPSPGDVKPYERGELGVPEGAFVAAAAGRHVKFQGEEFWRAVGEMLEEHPGLHFLALGLEESQVAFLPSVLSPEARGRVRFVAWGGEENYLRALCASDLLVDTFPSGGGTVFADAMALGIPVVTFRNNYLRLFDQNDWSPAGEIMNVPEVIVPRGDFAEMKRVVARMINDEEFRLDVARRGQEYIRRTKGDPPRAIREFEDVYFRVLGREPGGAGEGARDALGAEIEEASRRRAPTRAAPGWVAWPVSRLKRALRFGERVLDRIA
jgi:hypothetical protein